MIAPLDKALFYCKKYFGPGTKHEFSSPTGGLCPEGHKLDHFPTRASAHYVVERANHRLDASQPYVDIVEVVPSNTIAYHGEALNNNSIGIEHSNVGWGWAAAQSDTFTGTGENKRPTDQNHWLHLPGTTFPKSNLVHTDFQAYQEEQYRGMILLLRYLCIHHRIPRRFLGDTTAEKMARWTPQTDALTRSSVMRFRGILSHMNCHGEKECGGPALHRSRLFRAIIDEWWLPIDFSGGPRQYYMGPFDPQPNQPSHFRFTGSAWGGVTFHDANLDALQETRSYFDLDKISSYYADTEILTIGGTYPIGRNKFWHGGIHFQPPVDAPQVYAAASGRIVAARLGSDAAVEADPVFGSQRFVLIRHTVYWRQEADPGGGERTDYTTDPTYFFTLYMHLAAPADIAAESPANPPWLNFWHRRKAAGADASKVFNPDVAVSVGDWLGNCGIYKGQQMIHFEVVGREELSVAPWDDSEKRIHDTDTNVICDDRKVEKFVTAIAGQPLSRLDVLRAAKDLRKVKSYHKSEWSLADAAALTPVIPNATQRNKFWNSLKHFMWHADALAACPDLTTQLAAADGLMWHYHPITFMHFVNGLILKENGQVSEPDSADTNVTMEGEFLTNYVTFASGSAVGQAADKQPIKPFSAAINYSFTRKELACNQPVPHEPDENPPHGTRFHLTLLDVLENVRQVYANSITVSLSHVCAAHNVDAHNAACVLGNASGRAAHNAGLAVDIRPSGANLARCRALLRACREAAARILATCGEHGGEPSRGDLPGHVQGVTIATDPVIEAKINDGKATAAQIVAFTIHIELIEKSEIAYFVASLRNSVSAKTVYLSGGSVMAEFEFEGLANGNREPGSPKAFNVGSGWMVTLITKTKAVRIEMRGVQLVGMWDNFGDAKLETDSGNPWVEKFQL